MNTSPKPLSERTVWELREAAQSLRERIKGIDDGTQPSTPDSRPNAVQSLNRINAELDRRPAAPTKQQEDIENLRFAANEIAEAKGQAQDILMSWSELPDTDAASGELEQAIALLGRVERDLDFTADELEDDKR